MKLRAAHRIAVVVLLVAGLLLALPAARAQLGQRLAQHVVLISIDGFGADNFDDRRLPLPNLRRLAAEGARAERMSVVTPSVTWPNHTTLVTGVYPAKHGVMVNGLIEPSTGEQPLFVNPRRSKDELCRFPTLYDLAHQSGLRTAEVNWPVTRGARTLDFSFPDYPDAIANTTPQLLQEITAAGLLPEATDEAFRGLGSVMRDYVWTQTATHLIRRHRPNLLLLHLLLTDSTQHAHGPETTEAFAALSLADRLVGDVVQAAAEAGIRDRTTFIITADHGFNRITHQIRPNARLRERGLIRGGDGAPMEYDAQAIPAGGVALVYVPKARLQPELVAKTREALQGIEGVDQVLTPEEFRALGIPVPGRAPQAPEFVLTALDPYSFNAAVAGDVVQQLARPNGTHGFAHTNPRMDALLVASGAGVARGVKIEKAASVDVAPTIARLLNLRPHDVDGRVLEEFIRAE